MKLRIIFAAIMLFGLSVMAVSPHHSASAGPRGKPADKIITLLFTNDVESAYDPIPAHWLDDLEMIGGIAEMTTLIRDLRSTRPLGERLLSVRVDGLEIGDGARLSVAVPGFLAEGGDLYDAFPEGRVLRKIGQVSDVIITYFSARDSVVVPPRGRQQDRSEQR